MLNIKDYSDKIEKLYLEGKTAKEISTVLGFKYHQPVYNFFKRKGWERTGKSGKRIWHGCCQSYFKKRRCVIQIQKCYNNDCYCV